jgi:hypothetical protein
MGAESRTDLFSTLADRDQLGLDLTAALDR